MTWSRRLLGTERPSLIIGGQGALDSLEAYGSQAAQAGSRLFVLTDENVNQAWGATTMSLLGTAANPNDMLILPPGETTKSLAILGQCWEWLAERGARRDDTVIALGGGMVGDLAGFTAATYLRGVSLWQIPTSLLAQVDSSVGGKTAVNLHKGKNLVGAFYQPDLVVADPRTLSTLPNEEYVSGLGEVVKYGLLDTTGLFAILEQKRVAVKERDPDILAAVVQRCVEYKACVVEEDERDAGRRAVLNLGHTVAHALEVACGYGTVSHGKGVALGLLVALAISERLLGLNALVRTRTRRLMVEFGLPTALELPSLDSLLAAASRDKKVTATTSGFVGLEDIGKPVWGVDVSSELLTEALEVIRA